LQLPQNRQELDPTRSTQVRERAGKNHFKEKVGMPGGEGQKRDRRESTCRGRQRTPYDAQTITEGRAKTLCSVRRGGVPHALPHTRRTNSLLPSGNRYSFSSCLENKKKKIGSILRGAQNNSALPDLFNTGKSEEDIY